MEATIIKRPSKHRRESVTRVEIASASQLLTGTKDRRCISVFRTAPPCLIDAIPLSGTRCRR
jgi:hypothetical protein